MNKCDLSKQYKSNVNIYLKNICYLVNQSNGEIDVEYCHRQLDKFYNDKKNAWIEVHLDHEMQDRWNKLIERKNDLLETSREKNFRIRELEDKIKNYEEIVTKYNILKNDQECQTDGIEKEEKASFCDIIKKNAHHIKNKIIKKEDSKKPFEIKLHLSLNDIANNTTHAQYYIPKNKKIKKRKRKIDGNIKNNKRRRIEVICIDNNNNQRECEEKENKIFQNTDDDNHSVVTSITANNSTIKTSLSTRSLARTEWNLYRDSFQTFIKSYTPIPCENENNKKREKERIQK